MKDSLGLAFLDRTLRTSSIVVLVFMPFGVYYLGIYRSIAVLSGACWGIVNFVFLSALVRSVLRPEGADRGRALWLGLIKFPLLYLAGYGLLSIPVEGFTPGWLLAGFSIVLGVMALKAMSRAILKIDNGESKNERIQEAG
ncbi:MAG TPA: hypothetical protein PLF13_04270 [candidate division Zixibacteria bacterium]|nr:hypothetical protein [candidate division Zixibacteria bacterium]